MAGCIHRYRDCESIAPGVQQCQCGQMFVFIEGTGCGRYKKIEDVTEEERGRFSPETEQGLLDFMKGG